MPAKTQEEEIKDGKRIEQLLADPAVQQELAALDARYWQEAKSGKSDAEIVAAVAKARALGDLSTRLISVVHDGKIATATRERTTRR